MGICNRSGASRATAAFVALVTGTLASSANAGIAQGTPLFDNASIIAGDNIFIDFETDGAGAPVDLLDGQSLAMPANEYADYDPMNAFNFTTGVSFSPQVNWVNDGNLFDNILDAFASAENGIPSANIDEFTLNFSSPVTSFGLWVADNDSASTGTQPIFTVRDTQGAIITVLDFNSMGGAFHDGTINIGGDTVNYGFMGYALNPGATVQIGSVDIVKGESIFDDLAFVPVPAPSTLVLLSLAAPGALRRRR